MLKPVEAAEASRLLESALLGEEYTSLSAGDWWGLHLTNDLTLLAHEFRFAQEAAWTELLASPPFSVLDGVDSEFVPWAVQIFRCMRREIVAVSVDVQAALTLSFEGGGDLTCRTDVAVVDWQWALSFDRYDAYAQGGVVGCYSAPKIEADLESEFWTKTTAHAS